MHLSSSFSRHQAPADSAQRRQNLRLWVKACFRHTPVSQPACCDPAQGLKALTALGASRWKRPPSPVRYGVISALGALVLTGCGTPILRANFDTNSLGTHPGPELPGEPVGDSFYLSAPTSGSAVVVAAPEGLSGRSLRYRHSAPMAYSRFLGFGGKEVSASSQQYWAVWNAIPQLTPNVPLDVWIGDGHFGTMGKIRFLNSQVLVATDVNGTSFAPIGPFTNGRVHTVVMKVDKPSATYRISVLGGEPAVNTGTRAVLTPATLTSTRPYVYLWFGSDGVSASTYTVDNVLITEACPTDRGVGACD